jgi:hypothetical protein
LPPEVLGNDGVYKSYSNSFNKQDALQTYRVSAVAALFSPRRDGYAVQIEYYSDLRQPHPEKGARIECPCMFRYLLIALRLIPVNRPRTFTRLRYTLELRIVASRSDRVATCACNWCTCD